MEALEERHLLSITLPNLDLNQTVLAGAPLVLGLDSFESSGHALSYTVSVNNSSMTGGNLSASVPTGNPSLQLTVSDAADGINGTMTFQLFEDLTPETVQRIIDLVNFDYYDGLTFHRIIEDFMIQGGDPNGDGTGGPDIEIDDEFNPTLQFTGPGVLAMANSGSDTNGSQFFITTASYRWGDFRYTIFGHLTEGQDILDAIEGVDTGTNDAPVNDVVITDASMITDIENGILRLSAPLGASGTAEVTVTVTDLVTNETQDLVLQITVGADTNDNRPYLGSMSPIQTNVNTPVTFYIPATDIEGSAVYYGGIVSPANSNLSIDVDDSTGQVTITPTNDIYGVFSIEVGVRAADAPTNDSVAWDTQFVSVYINPSAPTSIQLLDVSDTGTSGDNATNLNNSAGNTLQFEIDGVLSGALVQLFSDGTLIGEATASDTTVTITTNATETLTDGTHQITATQTLASQSVNVGNLHTTVDLSSSPSSSLEITVDATAPVFDFTPILSVIEGDAYSCQATATDNDNSLVYQLDQAPNGMTIDPATGLITWTPTASQLGSHDIVVRVTDTAGNTTDHSYTLMASPVNAAPVLTPAGPWTDDADEDTPYTFPLTGTIINNGDGTTGIDDADEGAAIGGIALIGFTGNGTLEYSLDGTTFTAVGSVSESSALLLPKTATLRYTPDGQNGETATITYHAWDTATGVAGELVDLSVSGATGGSTAFSTAFDTASLVVADVNDAPALTATNPSLGSTSASAAIVISLTGSFINNGDGTTGIDDVDQGAATGGIAVTGLGGGGIWDYSLDGTTYQAVGTVSETGALMLPKTATLRFTPTGDASGEATITFRAWDASDGAAGEKADTTANGATTAFSTALDTATLSINDAPVLTPNDPSLGTTDEDTAATVGLDAFINGGAGTTTVAELNSNDALGGIALIGMTGDGTWQYSLDGGATFIDITSVAPESAMLLPHDALLRYTSNHQNAETATISYRAWDATQGTAGSQVDLTAVGVGGTTAFSEGIDTATLTVTGVNDAPQLTVAAPELGTALPSVATVISLTDTFINHGTGTTTVADVDDGEDYAGIALIGATGDGTWEYSLNGTTYQAIGTVSETNALLLPKTAKLRFTPNGADSQDAVITYHAWDATTGTAGEKVDLSVADATGGTTAFSLSTDTATLAVNNAPELTAATPSLGTTDEDTAIDFDLTSFIGGGTGQTAITDANANDTIGGIAVVGLTGDGTWQYSLDGGTTFVTITSIGADAALLLPADAKLRYTPNAQNGETATITYRAWDATWGTAGGTVDLSAAGATGGATAFSLDTDTASLAVIGVNDAPNLVAAGPSLGSTTIHEAIVISLTDTFIGSTSGLTQITDVDPGAEYEGIALTGLTGNGLWEYSLDGTNYTSVGNVSDTEALLLPKTAKLRYTPDGSTDETATITYRAWDATQGTACEKVDVSTNGDATAFSAASDTASLAVVNPNTSPVLTAVGPSLGNTNTTTAQTLNLLGTFINNGTGSTTITDSDTDAVVGGIAITGTTGSGTWSYTLDGTTYTDIGTVSDGSALLLPKTAAIRYTPDGSTEETASITYRAWDTTTGTAGEKVDAATNGSGTAFSTVADTASLLVTSATLSGFVYIDSNNDGLRLLPGGASAHPGIQGVVVTLLQQSGSTWSTLATTMTAADGSYQFDGLLPGAYKVVETQPALFVDGKETLGKVDGATKGTAAADAFFVELTAGQTGTEYNFGERGLAIQAISMRMCLASSPSGADYVAQFQAPPVVSLSNSAAGCGYTTIQASGSTAVQVAPAATIHDVDSASLAWMTVTIVDPSDGDSEILAAVTTNTTLTASYNYPVLTISGVASADVYEQVLKSITFQDDAATPTGGDRTIEVIVNDGRLSSRPDLTLAQSLAAIDAVLARTAHWL